MPSRITPNETTRPVAFTLTESDIAALDALAEREDINRSAWIRARIRREAVSLGDLGTHDHLPIERDERSRSWWVRLGKSNPNKVGGHCVACWGDAAPVRVRRVNGSKSVWKMADGSEVIA